MNGLPLTQDQMTAIAQTQATKLRVARRPLLPMVGQGYVSNVVGHRVLSDDTMSIKPNQALQPLQMSRRFLLNREQCADASTLTSLITFAAADIAQAEDAVVLLGADAKAFLGTRHITFDAYDLAEQEGLYKKPQPKVGKPLLESVLEGIRTLQQAGQSGDYYVIVSPDLYQEAYTPRVSPLDAPIYQIQPLLASQGFLYCEAAPPKTGVIFSLARGTISLSVPMDTYVDTSLPNDDEGRPHFAVSQQFRLIIDDPQALSPLK